MNESDPCRCRKSMASPPSPQPKQWKWPRLESTVKDGVFSWWNGHRPFMRVPPAGRRATYSPTRTAMSVAARTSAIDSSRIRPATAVPHLDALLERAALLFTASPDRGLERQPGKGAGQGACRHCTRRPGHRFAVRPQGRRPRNAAGLPVGPGSLPVDVRPGAVPAAVVAVAAVPAAIQEPAAGVATPAVVGALAVLRPEGPDGVRAQRQTPPQQGPDRPEEQRTAGDEAPDRPQREH